MIKDFKLFKKPISLWLVTIILLAVSVEGILSFPGLLKSSQTIPQYLVIITHASYVLTGIVVIVGLWLSHKATLTIVIIWGIVSLGAALGGPLAFSQIKSTFPRTAIIIALLIFLITAGLFLFTRYIIKKNK
jgi:hypothetical protein